MLADVERAWVRALHEDEPLAALAREAQALAPGDCAAALAAAGDGFVVTSLLVKKLRFESIVRGDRAFEAWFDRDPQAFTDAFRAYAREVEPRAYFPVAEAASFRSWCARGGVSVALDS